jgi:hypothetical protein
MITKSGYVYLNRNDEWEAPFGLDVWGDSVNKATRLEIHMLIADIKLKEKLLKWIDS